MNAVGMLLVLALLGGPPPTSADWSVTPAFGPAISAPGSVANPALVPGQASTSGYLITHTDQVDGPLDITASSTDAPSTFENDLLVSVGVNGVTGQTTTLGQLLRHSGIARATTALPSAPVMLTVSIELSPTAPAGDRTRLIDFTLFVTVSDQVVALPAQPSDPGGRVAPPLASTGQVISAMAIVIGFGMIVAGAILLLRRRRRAALPNIRTGTD